MAKKQNESDILVVKHYRAQKAYGEKELIIEHVTDDSETAQFLNRVEAARLNKPYDEAIDMRDKVLWDCKAYQFNNKTHYFDDISLAIFKEEVKRNHGVLNVGAYEKILYGDHTLETRAIRPVDKLNGVQPKPKKLPTVEEKIEEAPTPLPDTAHEDTQEEDGNVLYNYATGYSPKLVQFGYFLERTEPRLQYKMNIHVQGKNINLDAITKDISKNGIRFCFPIETEKNLTNDAILSISFPSLKNKDSRFRELPINYRVMMIGEEEEQYLISCELIRDDDTEWVQDFFHTLIQEESKRYKFDPEDETLTRTALCYQEIYNHSISNIPVFISKIDGHTFIDTMGITENNISLLDFFSTGEFNHDLSAFRIPDRINSFLPSEEDACVKSSLIVLYKDKNKIFSSTNFENSNENEFRALINYARRKNHFRVLKLIALNITNPLNKKVLDHFSESLLEKSPEDYEMIHNKISSLKSVALITDISYLFPSRKIRGYSEDDDDTNDPSSLFVWSENKKINLIENTNTSGTCELAPLPQHLPFKHYPTRREPRYLARTKIEIEINGKRYTGTTRDLSIRGLRLELDKYVSATKGTAVTVGFQSFKQKRSGFDKNNIAYKIVDTYYENEITIISLSREIDEQWNQVTAFFEDIIDVNRSKLRLCINDAITSTMTSLYEHLYSRQLASQPFFLTQTSSGNIRIERTIQPNRNTTIYQFFTNDQGDFDLSPLSVPSLVKNIHHVVNSNIITDHLELYFYKDTDSEDNMVYQHASNYTLTNKTDRLMFIQKCLMAKEHIFLKVSAAETTTHYNYLETQTSMLRTYSKHIAAKLYQELEQVIGHGELIDITSDITLSIELD